MTCSLTKYLDTELKQCLSKDEYCTYDNVLNAMYQAAKDHVFEGKVLNEYAFKDFMGFFCVLMIKLFNFSSKTSSNSFSRSHVSRFLKSHTRKQIGGAKKHISIVYFLLSAYLFYNSYREFGNAITIPDNLLAYVEENHPQSEKLFSKIGRDVLDTHKKSKGFFESFLQYLRPAREILELLHKFITETLSEIAKQDYIKALYDSTYTSGCIRDFNLIFTKKNLGTLIERVDVLKDHEGEIRKLYIDKYPFQGFNMNEDTLDDARTAQSKFNDAMSLFKDTFGIAEYKSSCLVTSILKKEGDAKAKRKQDENELIKRMSKWMSKINSSAGMVQLLFCNIVMSGLILIFILGSEQEKRGRSYNTTENNLAASTPTVKINSESLRRRQTKRVEVEKNEVRKPVNTGPSYLNQLKSTAYRSSLKVGSAIKNGIRGSLKNIRVKNPFTKKDFPLFIDEVPERPKKTETVNPVLQVTERPIERRQPLQLPYVIPKEPETVLRQNRNGALFIYHRGDEQEVLLGDFLQEGGYLNDKYKDHFLQIIAIDPKDGTRLLCKLKNDKLSDNGKTFPNGAPFPQYWDSKTGKYYDPPSLSLNGLISYSYYETYPDGYRFGEPRYVVRYEENNKRYYIEKGRLIAMEPSYQAAPPKPKTNVTLHSSFRYKTKEWISYNSWWEKNGKWPQVNSNVNLLDEHYDWGLPSDELFTPLEPGHLDGFMDVRGTISQLDYIEQKVRTGRWRYDKQSRTFVSTGLLYDRTITLQQPVIPLWVEMDRKSDARIEAKKANNAQRDEEFRLWKLHGDTLFSGAGHGTYGPRWGF